MTTLTPEQNAALNRAWNFSTLPEKAVITLTGAASIAAFTGALSMIFNPLVLVPALAYGALKVGDSLLYSIPQWSKIYFDKMVKQKSLTELPADAPVAKMAAEISEQLGRKTPPTFYVASPAYIAKSQLPFGLRWLINRPDFGSKTLEKIFAAFPGTNRLITTDAALKSTLKENEIRFIVAHEMSHLKNEFFSPATMAKTFIKHTSRALMWTCAAGIALALGGVALPVSIGGMAGAAALLAAARFGANRIQCIGNRTFEHRADRNAVFLTRDLEGAVGAMAFLHESDRPKKSKLYDWFLTHPSHGARVETLTNAFKKASKIPGWTPPVNDNAAETPKPENGMFIEDGTFTWDTPQTIRRRFRR